jgi:hypothetical protein
MELLSVISFKCAANDGASRGEVGAKTFARAAPVQLWFKRSRYQVLGDYPTNSFDMMRVCFWSPAPLYAMSSISSL